MGWWNCGKDGTSLHALDTGMVWGDSVADIMDDAIKKIEKEFEQNWQTKPTRDELIAGLLFSISVDYPEEK